MTAKKKYSWIFLYYNALNGEVCYRLHHELTVDDVEFLANEFCKANSNYCLGVFRFQFYKKNISG